MFGRRSRSSSAGSRSRSCRAEIHDGDPLVRADWPWRWWGLEPLDRRRPDWETRYSAVFRIENGPLAREQRLGDLSLATRPYSIDTSHDGHREAHE